MERQDRYTIYGDGTNLIDAMFVDDAVDAIEAIIRGAHWNDTINLAGGSPVTVESLVRAVAEALELDSISIDKAGAANEKNDFWGSAGEMRELYGFAPRVTLLMASADSATSCWRVVVPRSGAEARPATTAATYELIARILRCPDCDGSLAADRRCSGCARSFLPEQDGIISALPHAMPAAAGDKEQIRSAINAAGPGEHGESVVRYEQAFHDEQAPHYDGLFADPLPLRDYYQHLVRNQSTGTCGMPRSWLISAAERARGHRRWSSGA